MTMGELSVKAMIPRRRSGVSGPSGAAQAARAEIKRDPASNAAAPPTKFLRDMWRRFRFEVDVMATILVGPRFERISARWDCGKSRASGAMTVPTRPLDQKSGTEWSRLCCRVVNSPDAEHRREVTQRRQWG
jgi:hypothetical protein